MALCTRTKHAYLLLSIYLINLGCRTHTHTHTARMHLIACICYTFRRKYVSNVFNMIELINAAKVLNMVYNFVYTFDYTIIINFALKKYTKFKQKSTENSHTISNLK